jgi:phage replication O-like protein O
MSNLIKPFARQGHFTAVDNAVFDAIMPILSSSEWKVLCFIIRKTIGWQKEMDSISYSQIKAGTGIKTATTIQKAIEGLMGRGIIQRGETPYQSDPYYYKLNKDYTCGVTENGTRPITFSVTPLYQKMEQQKKGTKETKEIISR